ncbi:sensor histidine kinase [Winogradskya humida]|uniref:histidine kinase n=1 Tax=Winogradskya humida TaxID=113566 RepID=A0ABQ3ZPV6_9ACTN|nr:sensor histidine kinase [Actinoplanes humidus]GIE20606.1 histidine kinase [Actinoplanes humidus]
MPTTQAPTRALLDRRYLLTGGPWRALFYLFSTLPFAIPVAIAAGVLALPYLAAMSSLSRGAAPDGPVLFLMIVSLALLLVLGPLVAVPLGVVERARLSLMDTRPLPSPHPPSPADLVSWLRTRYSEPATWRELLYALFLATVVPAAYAIAGFLIIIEVALLLGPFFVNGGSAFWTIGAFEVRTPAQAIPLFLAGVLMVPVFGYLAGLLATGQAFAARALLGDRTGLELHQVAQSRARLADAFDLERRRIERDLHDGAQHRLTSLTLQLGMARLDVAPDSPAAEPLTRAHDQAKDLMVVLRDLIYGIRPQALTDLGLPAALRELAGRSPLPVAVTVADGVPRPAEQTEGTAYFAASEALANIVKHAEATRADILLARAGETLILEIRDDGQGGADPTRGTGLTGLADRVAASGGRLLLSSPQDGPTLLRIELPLIPAPAPAASLPAAGRP